MEKKRPQLNLSELYQLKWIMGGVLALLSAWTVLYMEVEATLWLVLITVTVPVVLRWPTLTLRVPRWAHRLAFPLFVALFATDLYFNRQPLPAMIRLALMLVFYRSITPRKRRDDLQLIVLGLFLVVIAGVLSVSLAFAVQILVFTACTLAFLLLITLIDSAEAGQPPAAEFTVDTPPLWMRGERLRLARRLRETTDWRVAAIASGLFAGVVGLSALLFFALPRFEIANTFFLENMISKKSRTGFSEQVRFGDVTDIQQDTSVALSVDVTDRRAIPASPYWRMLVLDVYDNGMFRVSDELLSQMRQQRRKSAGIVGTARPRTGDVVWTFYLEAGITRYLPMLGSFHQLQFNGGPQDFAINDELRMLRLEKTPPKMFAYRVDGMRFEPALGKPEIAQVRDTVPVYQEMPDDRGPRSTTNPPMPAFMQLSLEPVDLEKVSKWVRSIEAAPEDAQDFATKASSWLARNHSYSLQMNLGEGEGDPLVRWMDSKLPGHCELFAGAFTVLARSAGYPARMITGFRGGSWNTVSNNLVIRNSDAHAWCEIFDQKSQSWVRVDPTPGADSPGQQPAAENTETMLRRISDSSWSARLDSLRMFWYRRIVDFDQTSQIEMARDAKNAIESRAKKIKAMINRQLQAIGDWLQEPWDVTRWLAWIGVIGTAFGVVLGWRGFGRGWWLRWRSVMTRHGVDPVRREAGRWLRRMSERKPEGAVGDEWTQVRADLERLRYGPRQNWPNPQGAFRRAKRACKRSS